MRQLLLFVLVIALFLGSAEGPMAAEMFRGDAAHTGSYPAPPPSLQRVKWRFHAQGPFVSSPVVSNGVVYVGSNDHKVYAVRASDGTEQWAFATKGDVTSSPAVSNGLVIFASLDGYVYAIAANDGTPRWKFATQGERRFAARGIHGISPSNEMMPDPFDMFVSSPTVDEGVVFIGSGDHNVYALDAKSGTLRWTFHTGDVVHATPAVAGGVVYIGSWDRYFYALDEKTGRVLWKFLTGDDQKIHNQIGIQSSAAVADGMVFFGCRDSHLYALDAKTGALRWSQDEHGSWVISSPAIVDGTLYFTTSDGLTFYALDAHSGAERFQVKYSVFSYSSPAVSGGYAYFGTFDGQLYAVDAKTGTVSAKWMTDGAQKLRAEHLNARGQLDLRTFYTDNTLDGVIVGLHRLGELGSIVGSPAIADGVLYLSTTEGTLYALT